MLEAAIALGILLAVLVPTLLVALMPMLLVFKISYILILAGLGIGIPMGIVYHVKLATHLRALGPLPKRWWLDPTRHHKKLDATVRAEYLPWFAVGAVAFVCIIIGCIMLAKAAFAVLPP